MMARARAFRFVIVLVEVLAASFVATGASATRPALPVHAGPPPSAVSEFQPSVQYGGRTVSIDINPSNPSAAISATESGGLFTTSDAGANWQHVRSLPVFRMSEVRYSPDNPAIILATAWADDHVANQGGIWRSTDGGATWSRPPSGDPQNVLPFCTFRPNTWGIAFAKGTNDVFVGHDCGVAVSHDLGATWTQIQPDPNLGTNAGARAVYALTARASASGTIVDICANDGHHRSTDGGAHWTLHNTAADALAGCSSSGEPIAITESPYESGVLFAIVGPQSLFESDSAGANWTQITTPPSGFNRPWWVKANPSGDNMANHFDVYFGTGRDTYKQTCTGTGPGLRCGNTWTGVSVDHSASDSMEVAFSTAAGNNCAVFLAGDGGVHKTTDCGASFHITGASGHGYNALQLFEVTGETHPGNPSDYYFGTMDNNLWASGDSGATWPGVVAFEGFFIQLPHSSPTSAGQKVTFVACAGCNQYLSGPLFSGVVGWPQPPHNSGNPVVVDQGVYVEWTQPSPPSSQLSLTTNTGGSWTAVSGAVVNLGLSGLLKVAGPAASPTVYQAVSRPGNRTGLVKITGIRTGTATVTDADNGLQSIDSYCNGQGTLVCPTVFGVDPSNPNHLIAPDAGTGQMKVSTDGGASWQVDSALTNLVTGGGQFMFSGGSFGTVHAIAFDPNNGNHILVGTEQGGILASLNGGQTWVKLPGSEQIPAITSFFFDEVQNTILVSSYGRGLWKLSLAHTPQTFLAVGSPQFPSGAAQPFVTSATPFTLNAFDGTSGPASVSYRFFRQGTAPPAYTTVAGATATFHVTGPDGAYEVDYFSTNAVGDDETPHVRIVTLDNTPPVTTIVQPAASPPYTHDQTLTLNYTVSDGSGSGVKSFTALMDGSPALAGHGLLSGQVIQLLTEMSLGSHTFTVNATDNLGNSSSTSVTFTIIATAPSIENDVTQLFASGDIKNKGIENSLLHKLAAAEDAAARGNCKAAANIYNEFINEVTAQSGNGISATAAAILIADAQYIIAHLSCP